VNAVKRAPAPPEEAGRVCHMCGKPSQRLICEECSKRIHLEAIARKKREEQGNSWGHWE
jgi:hypothetical protein